MHELGQCVSSDATVENVLQTDEVNGFRTRSILCMPIRDAKRLVIGVALFVNKQDGTPFNKNDENLFEV